MLSNSFWDSHWYSLIRISVSCPRYHYHHKEVQGWSCYSHKVDNHDEIPMSLNSVCKYILLHTNWKLKSVLHTHWGKKHLFIQKSLDVDVWKMWILWKRGCQNVNSVKNDTLKMWILWKITTWKCEFCENDTLKCEFCKKKKMIF